MQCLLIIHRTNSPSLIQKCSMVLLMQRKSAWNIIIKHVGDCVCVSIGICVRRWVRLYVHVTLCVWECVGVCYCLVSGWRASGPGVIKGAEGEGDRGTVWDKAGGVCDLVGSGWMGLRSHGVKRLESLSGPSPSGIAGTFLFLVFFFTPVISSQSCSASCCFQNTSSFVGGALWRTKGAIYTHTC